MIHTAVFKIIMIQDPLCGKFNDILPKMCKTLFCHCMHQDVHLDWSLGGSLKHNWWMVMISWDTEILLRIIWYSCTNTCIENSFINNTTCFWFELLLLYFRAHSNIYIYLYFSLVSEWLAGTVYYNPHPSGALFKAYYHLYPQCRISIIWSE